MITIKQLEIKIGGFYKNTPALPNEAKKTLVDIWPWVALIFGILQIGGAWAMWKLTRVVDNLNDLYSAYYPNTISKNLSTLDVGVIYLAIVILLVDAAILLMAYPELKKRSAKGWDLLFLGSVVNAVYAVVSIFIDSKGGFGQLLLSLLGTAVGFYLLYQVKDRYHAAK